MKKGKAKCEVLKGIRKKIAEANEISYNPRECTHEGDCAGTCPACEAEVRYISDQLNLRRMAGKAVRVAGLAAGITMLSSCRHIAQPSGMPVPPPPRPNDRPERLAGKVPLPPDTTKEYLLEGDVPAKRPAVDIPEMLEGDVLAPEPENDSTCTR